MLVLGAGASRGARDGTGAPPLGHELASYILNWLHTNDPIGLKGRERTLISNPHSAEMPSDRPWDDGIDEVRGVLGSAMGIDSGGAVRFERVMDELAKENRLLLLNRLHRAIVWTMLTGKGCRFSEGVDRYDALFGHPRLRSATVHVATLNYDILAEEALVRLGRSVRYPEVSDSQEAGVPFYKLHGSVNWRQVTADGGGATIEIARENASRNRVEYGRALGHERLSSRETGANYVPPGGRINLVLELKQASNTADSIMAIYGAGKPVATNPACIGRVRQRCLDDLEQLGDADVTVVGLRPPIVLEDDPALTRLFTVLATLRGTRTYVSPASEHCAWARHRGFEARPTTLGTFLAGW